MSNITIVAVAAAVIVVLVSGIAVAVMHRKQRRIMDSIEEMLETARKGSFKEQDFDESRFSGSVKNVGVEDTPRISEPLSFFEKTLFSSAPTGVSHR